MLEVKDLAVSYGRHRALEGVGLRVEKGEVCVILGANGAGKSTLLKTIAGMVKADAGEVVMNGTPLTRLKPHLIVERGIALVPEGRGIFGDLTVAENLRLGAFARRARQEEQATLKSIYDLFPRLAERKGQIARTMSGGEQQMVAIGRALMSKPDILMLDEPSLGLSPILTQELFRSLTAVAATGVGILLVEQNAKQSLKIARRGYLIETGHVTGEDSAEALRNDPAVIAAYLGGGGRKGASASVRLPPPMVLPATLAAMGRVAGDLAARAGRIQQAFVRALRSGETLPSAFVGRYDPKAGGDPWANEAAVPLAAKAPKGPPPVADAARWLASSSANLALGAAERLSRHVAAERRAAAVPSAFAIRRAEERLEGEAPAAFGETAPPEPPRRPASHGLIGHNSAAAGIDDEDEPATEEPSRRGVAPAPSIADLAARATAIQRRHVEAQRRLRVENLPSPAPAPHPGDAARREDEAPPAPERGGPSIAELAARAADIQRRHVQEGRRSLIALSLRPTAPQSGEAPPRQAPAKETTRKKPGKAAKMSKAAGRKSARKGKKSRKKHEESR